MNWLKRLFAPKEQTSSSTDPTHTTFSMDDDELFNDNDDILEGVQFIATLHVSTPYAVLVHHDEVFSGPTSKAPTYGDQSQGIWIPKLKGDFSAFPESEHATDIGPRLPKTYLPFLLDFREIFESKDTDEIKIEKLLLLASSREDYSSIWKKLETVYQDFPLYFFYKSFLDLHGVGRTTSRNLYEAGFRSVKQIQNTEPSVLLKVAGVGPGLVKKMTTSTSGKA